MKKFLSILLLTLSLFVRAQVAPPGFVPNYTNTAYRSLSAYGLFGPPQDTFSIPTADRMLRWSAYKGDTSYTWSPIQQKWIISSGGTPTFSPLTTTSPLTGGPYDGTAPISIGIDTNIIHTSAYNDGRYSTGIGNTIYTGDGSTNGNRLVSVDSANTLTFQSVTNANKNSQILLYGNGAALKVEVENGFSQVVASHVDIDLISRDNVNNHGGELIIDAFDALTGAVYTDYDTSPTGIKYAADYSATFVDRSLIDKGYFTTNNGFITLVSGSPSSATYTADTHTFNGNIIASNLATSGSAPSTTGTTKMVITDGNGLLSFGAIPVGTITGTTDNFFTVSGSNLNTNKTFSVLTYSATPTWDLTTGPNKTITITGDPVISFSNAQSGDAISLIVTQDGTGSHSVTIGGNAVTVNPTASSSTVVGCIYNGTVWSCASGYSTNSGTNTGDVTLSGAGQTYLTIAGQVITANAVNLSGTHVTGTLAAARFGALTGDVTNSAGSYTTTIANSAITNAKVSASAAIAYSKLNLTGAILNADLAGSIAISKLAITGTPDGTKYLRDDGSWQTVTSGFASPMTTLGDIIYEDATPAAARLAGNTTTTKKFLRQTGNGTISAVPAWDVLVAGDIPDLSGTYQPLDADLTTIAGLTATTNNFLVSVSSAWASRTPAQVKTTLSLDNVDNTSDATKNSASVTLTNKTITAPVISSITNTGTFTIPTVTGTAMQYAEATTASNATWAPAGDARVNWYQLTAQAVAVTTVSAPSGTPANHNLIYIRVKDNGTARAISGWDGIYRAGTDLPFPTTTTVSKNMYVVFCYNSLDTKWDLVDVVNGLSLFSNLLLSIVFGGLVTFMEKRKRILRIAACISLLLLPFKVPFAATRFYFDRLNTSPISPAINAGWTKTTVAAYCMAYAGKVRWGRSASGVTQSSAVSGTTAPQKMVGPVYITQPLAAQTILSGATFTFQLRCIKTATAGTGNVWVYVRLCDNDGTNITEIGNCTNTANALTTTATDRNLVLTLGGNITVADNQRIIFEIGENFTTGTTTHTFGFNSSLGPGTGDHTSGDNTETSAFNSWCECSQTLTMAKIGNF